MPNSFHTFECALPDTGAMSFCVPIFRGSDESKTFIQSIDQNNIIVDFLRFESTSFVAVRSKEKISKQVGDWALFCFHFSNGDIVVGSRKHVADILRDRFKDLNRCPFAAVEAAKFIDDQNLIRRAAKRAFGKIAKYNLELAIRWRENAIAWRENAIVRNKWTPERIATLIALWNESLTTSEIGRRLGTTKNAVASKVRRLGLPQRRPSLKDEPEPMFVRLEALGPNLCSWPVGNPGEANFHFCAEPSVSGEPYCAKHSAMVHISLDRGKSVA